MRWASPARPAPWGCVDGRDVSRPEPGSSTSWTSRASLRLPRILRATARPREVVAGSVGSCGRSLRPTHTEPASRRAGPLDPLRTRDPSRDVDALAAMTRLRGNAAVLEPLRCGRGDRPECDVAPGLCALRRRFALSASTLAPMVWRPISRPVSGEGYRGVQGARGGGNRAHHARSRRDRPRRIFPSP